MTPSRILLALVVTWVWAPAAGPAAEPTTEGQLLVAAEQLEDPRFRHAVIYMCRHDADGAFGLILNKPVGTIGLGKLLGALGIPYLGEDRIAVRHGGPVDPAAGFVLHSGDYEDPNGICRRNGVAVTGSRDIFAAIAEGAGPKKLIVLFGYAGWAAGQLEGEIQRNDWVVVPADADLVFDGRLEGLWERARSLHGIEL